MYTESSVFLHETDKVCILLHSFYINRQIQCFSSCYSILQWFFNKVQPHFNSEWKPTLISGQIQQSWILHLGHFLFRWRKWLHLADLGKGHGTADDTTMKTKVNIYQTCVLHILYMGLKCGQHFQEMRQKNVTVCLHKRMNIKLEHEVKDSEVLQHVMLLLMLIRLTCGRLWLENVARMSDSHMP